MLRWTFLAMTAMGVLSCGQLKTLDDKSRGDGFSVRQPAMALSTLQPEMRADATLVDDQFECLLGKWSWFGSLSVEFRVTGQFDSNDQLARLKLGRTRGGVLRYDVVTQSMSSHGPSNLFAFKAAREDGAAYYQLQVAVKNKPHLGSTEDFSVTDPATGRFFMADYSWSDLHGNASSGVGVCYCPTCLK